MIKGHVSLASNCTYPHWLLSNCIEFWRWYINSSIINQFCTAFVEEEKRKEIFCAMNPTYLNTLQTSLHVTTLMVIWDIYTHGFVKHRKIFFCLCRWAFSLDTCIMHMHRFVQLLLVLTLRLLTSVPIYFNYDISGTYRLKTDKWFAGLNQNDCTCN